MQQLPTVDSSIVDTLTPLMISKRFYPLQIISQIDPYELLLDFSMMTDVQFKELLLTSSLNDLQRNCLHDFFSVKEDITFIRQLFNLINRLNYAKLQHQQWTHYYNLGLNADIWCGRVSKAMAQANSMPSTYGRRKSVIEQRQKYFEEQQKQLTNELEQYKEESSNLNIVMDHLVAIADDFIQKDQYQLRNELERRQHVLVYDAKDHELVHLFYQLKPRHSEVRIENMDRILITANVRLGSFRKSYMESYTRRARYPLRNSYIPILAISSTKFSNMSVCFQ